MHMLPANKKVLLSAVLDGVDQKMFALYSGGVGDLQLITAENYKQIGEQFFYGNQPPGGPKDGHYLLTRDHAQDIRVQLEVLTGTGKVHGGDDDEKEGWDGPKQKQGSPIKTVTLEDPRLFAEYQNWTVKDLSFGFSNTRLFYPIRELFSTLLLGITGVTFSVEVRSRLMNLSIRETAVADMNELLSAIEKVSGMFDEGLSVSLTMTYGEPPEVDEDFADSMGGLTSIRDELSISAHIEKAGGGPMQYEY